MKSFFRIHPLTLVLLLPVFLLSCNDCMEGNGKMATRSSRFTELDAVNLSVSADVKLVNDSTGIVRIEGESNVIEALILEQKGGRLNIRYEECFTNTQPVTIYIPMKTVKSLQISGSGSISSDAKLRAGDLELKISGSGDINVNVEAISVRSEISGSGNIILKGAAQQHKIEVNGSGDVDALDCPTGKVAIKVNGSGDCKVQAAMNLSVKINGSGSVYYKGTPDISSDISGSGSFEKLK
jgi:hypothetical protein